MNPSSKKRTSRAEWFEAALRILREEGAHAVRVERLARDLGTSKSGFYWHFKDRRDLEMQLLEYWAHEFTEVLSENVELAMLDPLTRLSHVVELVTEHDLSGYDLAFFAWAEHDPEVARRVETVIETRLEYIAAALSELGVEGIELDLKARLIVSYMAWEGKMFARESKKRRMELQEYLVSLLTDS